MVPAMDTGGNAKDFGENLHAESEIIWAFDNMGWENWLHLEESQA